jgi:hypothetical protein
MSVTGQGFFLFSGTVTPLAQYLLILPVLAHLLSFFLKIVLLLNYYGKILSMLKMYHKKSVIVQVIVWFVDAKFHKVLGMKYFVWHF